MDTSSNKLILISKLLLLTIPWKAVHFELTFLCQMFQLQTKLNSLCFGSVSLTRRGDSVTKNSQKIIKKLSELLSLRVQTRPRDTFSHSDLSLKRPRRPPPSLPIQAAFRSSRTSSSCRPCPRCFYASRQRLQAGKNEENSSTPQTETKHFIFFIFYAWTYNV